MTRETLYNGDFLTLYRLDGRYLDGHYEVVEHGAAVWRQVAGGDLNTSALALAYALGRAGKL
ncbi:hypothetical protein BH24DEI1_BH24DEI1_19790 [soil metagenome]|jgi:hypothetical protein|nr:hypothetical protein [Deinococcota bacterium]